MTTENTADTEAATECTKGGATGARKGARKGAAKGATGSTAPAFAPRRWARLNGLAGVVMLISGTAATMAGSRLIVHGDSAQTMQNIAAHAGLLRLAYTGNLVMAVAFIVYGLMLYRLLSPVNRVHAALMLVCALVSVPIFMLTQTDLMAALPLADAGQADAVARTISSYRQGTLVSVVFWGLWLGPLGLLVYRSGFMPKALGILLMLGTPGYLILFVQATFFPGSEATLWTNPPLMVTHIAELANMMWLLIVGVKAEAWPSPSDRS